MSQYGFRDGVFNAKVVKLGQKRYNQDVYPHVVGSTNSLADALNFTSTTATALVTNVDCPRNIVASNLMLGAAERAMDLIVKGYTGQGEYVEETISLATVATSIGGRTETLNAFSKVTEIVPAVATKGYGTYGTVSIHSGDKIGITEYCEDQADILDLMFYIGTADDGFTASVGLVTGTTFSKTYQTLDLTAIAPTYAGSTLVIKYLSRLQNKHAQ